MGLQDLLSLCGRSCLPRASCPLVSYPVSETLEMAPGLQRRRGETYFKGLPFLRPVLKALHRSLKLSLTFL